MLVVGLASAAGCGRSPSEPAPEPAKTALSTPRATSMPPAVVSTARTGTSTPRAATLVRFVPAPGGIDAVEPVIQEQLELASAAGERALVYVGAPWCEPCQRFRAAVTRGELDDLLGRTRFVEFDEDRHKPALARAGYLYELIPVIAIPASDGRASGRLLSGSIKGPSAVENDLVPRLRALLAGREVD